MFTRKNYFVVSVFVISLFIFDVGWCDEPFNYFVISDWNVVGLKDYKKGTRITPYNRLVLGGDDERTEHEADATVQFRYGRELSAFGLGHTKTCLKGWMPIILTSAQDGPVRYDLTFWATPMPTVKDWQKAYDWPTEGDNFLTWILIKATNTGAVQSDAKFRVEQWGDKFTRFDHPIPRLKDPMDFTWSLAPGEVAEGVVRLPFYPVEDNSVLDKEDYKLWLQRTINYWQETMDKATQIQVPSPKAVNAHKFSNCYQLIASDLGEVRGGEGLYDCFWIRDGAYQVMALEEAGLIDCARRSMESYLRYQNPTGQFNSTAGQFDANGMAPWVLWQFYKISGDSKFLERAYPQMRKAMDFLMKKRREEPRDGHYAGLLPIAPDDGENYTDGDRHIVGYDFWNLRGLLCTADAARILGKEQDANELFEEAKLYRADIEAAWKRLGISHFPPAWEIEDLDLTTNKGTHWGNTENLWPTELFALDDPRVLALDDEVRNHHGGGFTEGLIHWTGPGNYNLGILHTYMSNYTTMGSLARDNDEQVVQDFFWLLLHSTAAHAFSEGINWQERGSTSDTIPHVTAAAMCSIMLRHMLIHERVDHKNNNELYLLRAIPDWWLEDGREIRVERAPTHFGEMSMIVRGTADGVKIDLDLPKREKPARIILTLPASRPLIGNLEGVEVITRPDQEKRWDFPTVVEMYKQNAKSEKKLINEKSSIPDIDMLVAYFDSVEAGHNNFTQDQCWANQKVLREIIENLAASTETEEAKAKGLTEDLNKLRSRGADCLKLIDAKLRSF